MRIPSWRPIAPRCALTILWTLALPAYLVASDSTVHLPPAYDTFLPPAAGASYQDQVFGTSIKRLSDARHTNDHAAGTGVLPYVGTEYSTASPFNRDTSRLILVHGSYFGLYDGTGVYLRDLPLAVNADTEPRWSRTDPNILFYVTGNSLKKLNVASGASSLVHSFIEYAAIRGRGESDISRDGDHFVFAGDDLLGPVGNNRYVFVYEISTLTKSAVLDTKDPLNPPDHPYDNLYIASDNSVLVGWIPTGTGRFEGVELFDRNMVFQRQLTHAIGHQHLTRDTNGIDVLVWNNSADPGPFPIACNNGIVKVRLSNAEQTCLLPLDWSLAVHITAPDGNGWAYVETYAPGDPPPVACPPGQVTGCWAPYTNEILRVKLDGSGVTERLLHHRSRQTATYEYQPRATVSRDGNALVYTSNYKLQALLGYPIYYTDAYLVGQGIAGALPADLAITKTNGQATAIPGEVIDYTIVATNLGPNYVLGATVTDNVPASLTGSSWTCAGAGGGECTALGTGRIDDTVNLPMGSSVTYTLTATVSASASSLSNTATITVPPGTSDPNPANNSATDDDTPRVSDVRVMEGNSGTSQAVFVVRLAVPVGSPPVTVDYETVDGSAIADSDYLPESGTLTFLPGGVTEQAVSVTVLGDVTPEPNEAFFLRLSSAAGFLVGRPAQATIVDDDTTGGVPRFQASWQGFFAVSTLETPYVGDFDGDGKTDIITFTRQNPAAFGDVYVSLSTGTSFGPSTKWHDFFAINTSEQVVIGDYDGDGKDDIATWLAATTRQVYVARSFGTGMRPAAVWANSIGFDPSDVLASGDVNGDGKKDLVLFARKQGKVYVALSDGTSFGPPTVWHSFFAVSTRERPAVADLNGDGMADIVTFATDSPTAFGDVYVALSDGARFGDGQNSDKWHDFFAIRPTEVVRIGDLDGDGRDDFFTFLPPPFAQCYTSLSAGTSMGGSVLWPEPVSPLPSDKTFTGDVNGDGKADIITFAQAEGRVYVSLAP